MSSSRLLTRVATAGLLSLALVGGTASASLAATAKPTTAAAATAIPRAAADNCASATAKAAKAKQKVKKSKKAVKKAKSTRTKADDKKAAKKLKKAKKSYKAKKAHKAKVCREENATNRGNDKLTIFQTLVNNPVINALPAQLRTPLVTALNQVITSIESALGQIPGADRADVSAITNFFNSLDPSTLESALGDLQSAVTATGGGDPTALLAFLEGLGGTLPSGTSLPGGGDLADLQGTLTGLAGSLGSFDPSDASQVTDVVAQIQALAGQLGSAQSGLTSLFSAISALNGGNLPTDPADFADILGTGFGGTPSLPFTIPNVLDIPGVVTFTSGLTSLLSALSSLGGGPTTPLLTILSALGL